jgi:hypothetical protein
MEKYHILWATLAISNLIVACSTKNDMLAWVTGILAVIFLGLLTAFIIAQV